MSDDRPGSEVPRPWPLPERLERYRSPIVAACVFGGVAQALEIADREAGLARTVTLHLPGAEPLTVGELAELANAIVGDAGGIAVVEAALRGEAPAPTLAGERRRGYLEALCVVAEIMAAPNEGRVLDALAKALAVECDAADARGFLPRLDEPMREALAPVVAALAAQEEGAARHGV